MADGWVESAQGWIADMGDAGDYARAFVLDTPMLARIDAMRPADALDVGCGEGRFCRLLQCRGVATIGIDPTEALIAQARQRDPSGTYRLGRAENIESPDVAFDVVICYLTLIDIDEIAAAIAEMNRVLRPGGRLLIANLTSFNTAGSWFADPSGVERFAIDKYFEERAEWIAWRGIRVRNWHRPLSRYMTLCIDAGLRLTYFDEPQPLGGPPDVAERYRRSPWFHIMEWQKPAL